MTRESTVQDSSAEVVAAALNEIQHRRVMAQLHAATLAAEEAAAPVVPNGAPAFGGHGQPA